MTRRTANYKGPLSPYHSIFTSRHDFSDAATNVRCDNKLVEIGGTEDVIRSLERPDCYAAIGSSVLILQREQARMHGTIQLNSCRKPGHDKDCRTNCCIGSCAERSLAIIQPP